MGKSDGEMRNLLKVGELVETHRGIHHLLVDPSLTVGARGLHQATNTFRVIPTRPKKVLYIYGNSAGGMLRVGRDKDERLEAQPFLHWAKHFVPFEQYAGIIFVSCYLGSEFTPAFAAEVEKYLLADGIRKAPYVFGSRVRLHSTSTRDTYSVRDKVYKANIPPLVISNGTATTDYWGFLKRGFGQQAGLGNSLISRRPGLARPFTRPNKSQSPVSRHRSMPARAI